MKILKARHWPKIITINIACTSEEIIKSLKLIIVFIVIFLEVQFNFSTPLLMISEEEDLPSRLSIIKIGQNEPDISFQVTIIEGTPELLNEMGKNCYK